MTSEIEHLRAALREIDSEIQWFFSCGGAISSDDLRCIIRSVRERIDDVRGIVWPDDETKADRADLSSEF
jgi:hypothetical protein